jgi:hypothetical protein
VACCYPHNKKNSVCMAGETFGLSNGIIAHGFSKLATLLTL